MAERSQNRAGENQNEVEYIRRLARTMAHPLRYRLLNALASDSPLGADALAKRTGEPVHKVRRHLNTLVAAELVDVAREDESRGAIKRYFATERRPWTDIAGDRLLDDRDRRRSTVGTVRVIFEEATGAANSPSLAKREDRLCANVSDRVDEQGWRELSELHHEMLARVMTIVAASRERLESGDEEPIGIISDQILLEAPQHGIDTNL
jgi:DNA-binding transcriptional ArsR family regulator